VLVSEPCSLQPRAIARVRALRDSLMRLGWTAPPRATETEGTGSASACQQESDTTPVD
jgi:hypothetical protein